MKRISLVVTLLGLLAPVAFGDTVIVNDDFEAYDDYSAGTNLIHDTWVPQNVGGGGEYGLADTSTSPDAFPGAGQGGGHIGGPVAIYQSTNAFGPLAPTATSKVVLKFDMFDDNVGNKRITVGLRESSGIANLFELGMYNVASAQRYAVRMVSFDGTVYPPHHDPANGGWFGITDLVDDSGTPIAPPATGQNSAVAGWHTMMAEFYDDHVDITLDLNRDGNINAVNTVLYNGFNLAGNGGFQQIRFGSPSGITSPGGGFVIDNVYLALEDVVIEPGGDGDHNGDGVVDAADYALWRSDPSSFGDAQGYQDWVDNFGTTVGSGGATSLTAAIPEPTAVGLLLLGSLALAAGRRRR